MGTIHAIRRLRHVKKWSERRISRELGVSRNTVRSVLKGEHDGRYTMTKTRARPVIGPHMDQIRAYLKVEQEDDVWRKQRLTAKRIGDLLRTEHDYTGSQATVRRAVRQVRLELGLPLKEAFVPLAYEPSVDAQADFFEADVHYRGGIRRTRFLLLRGCYSTRPFVRRVPAENQEALFEALDAGFRYFGGVFHHVWFDNMSLVVEKILGSRSRKVHRRFEDFRLHYAFEADYCAPAKGSDKGLVENGVRYVRQNALTPVPDIQEWEELDHRLDEWMTQEDGRVPASRDKPIAELWAEEIDGLIPLPSHPFDGSRHETRKVSAHSLVTYKTNLYSVPVELVGSQVTVKAYAERIEIHGPRGKAAGHERSYGRGETSFVLEHYLALLHWKPRAFDRAAPVREARKEWPPAFGLFLRVLRSRLGDADGTRSFIEVLWLHEYHDADRVHAAVRHALTHQEPSYAAVLAHLDLCRREDSPRENLSEDDLNQYPDAQVDDKNIEDYDQLRRGGSE